MAAVDHEKPPCHYRVPSETELKNFKFMRFTYPDMHGISRSKLIPCRNVIDMWKKGGSMYAGTPGLGPRSEVTVFPEIEDINYGNMLLRPVTDTMHHVPWAGGPGNPIGQVLCDLFWMESGDPHPADSRYIARKQLDQLHQEFGLKCLMGFEFEFYLLHKDTLKPVFDGHDVYTTFILSQWEDFLCKLDNQLHDSGLNVEHFSTEYDCGHFEAPTVPQYGITALDNAFLMKEGIKEISSNEGYEAVFMTKPFLDKASNGLHFNHSLWNDKGENVFYAPEEPNKMSATFCHWIGGVLKHMKALTAICSPTTNCYRRYYKPWTPECENWGIENRMASLRAKSYNDQETYLENRLSSAASNPYLLAASTIAAGMDGLRNKIEPPPQNDPTAPKVTRSLDQALNDLEQDKVICEALGDAFIKWFLYEKKSIELARVNSCQNDQEKFNVEKVLYKLI